MVNNLFSRLTELCLNQVHHTWMPLADEKEFINYDRLIGTRFTVHVKFKVLTDDCHAVLLLKR